MGLDLGVTVLYPGGDRIRSRDDEIRSRGDGIRSSR